MGTPYRASRRRGWRRGWATAASFLGLVVFTVVFVFAIGAVVFFLGGLGLVLVGIDYADRWRIREKQDDEDTYLDDETMGQALSDPRHQRH